MDTNVIIGGSMAGLAQVFTGYPLDTLKVRLVNNNNNKVRLVNNNNNRIKWKELNLKRLYRGVYSPLLGSVALNVQTFYMFSYLQNKNYNLFTAGSITGIGLAVVESPTDLIKTRMQTGSSSYLNVVKSNYKNIFRGLGITTLRNSVSVGLYFYGFHKTKNLFENEYMGITMGGMAAGFLSWGPTYPLDNLKTQVQSGSDSLTTCIERTYKQYGMRGFWRGVGFCVARGMFVNPFVFLAYEMGLKSFWCMK